MSPNSPLSAVPYEYRLFIEGVTGQGKSLLCAELFVTMAPPRIVIDPMGSDMTAVPGAFTFSDPARTFELVGRHDTLRFVPLDPFDLDAYNTIYGAAIDALRPDPGSGLRRVGNLYVWADEAGIVLPVNKTPKNGARYVYAARKLSTGHMAAHTRPREVNTHCISDAQMVIMFDTPLEDDRAHLARCIGVPLRTLETAMASCPVDPPVSPGGPPLRGPLVWNQPLRRLTPYPPLKLVA